MRILVLTPYRYGYVPGPRSSIELWERVLKPVGIEFDYAPFETERLREALYQPGHWVTKVTEMARAYARRLREVPTAKDYDAVLVYREAALVGPALLERWVARTGTPIIYQLDDPLYVPYRSPANGYLSYLKFFGKVGAICRLSKVVIVNSSQHREYATRFNSNVRQIPSIVDGERYFPVAKPPDPSRPVCVGWSGSWSTVGNLEVIANVLRRLSRREDTQVHLIGAESFDLPGIEHTAQPWSAKTEVQDLRRIDVGLLPLPVNEWNKRKFYLKLVQYMTLGIPAVCTPLGSNPEVVEHGVTGLLADTPAEWRAGLERLVTDHELRKQMGGAAAEVAHRRYTLQANADAIVEAFRSALS